MKTFYLDIGNSYIKYLENNSNQVQKIKTIDLEENILSLFSKNSILYVSCVHQKSKELLKNYKKYFQIHYMDVKTSKKINLSKLNFRTLGTDRFAVCLASSLEYKEYSQRIIIDAGSCITIDYIDNNYLMGGLIIPNRHSQAAMLVNKIPQLENEISDKLLNDYANNTQEAINEGINRSLIAFIEKTINMHEKNILVIFCGGDREFFYHNCKLSSNKILESEDFLFKGIKEYFK